MSPWLQPVFGMTCPKCEAKVEAALTAHAQIHSAKASFLKDEVVLEGSATASVVQGIIEQTGYSIWPVASQDAPSAPPLSPILHDSAHLNWGNDQAVREGQDSGVLMDYFLAIEGMACAGCVATVEKTLSESPGAIQVVVNFAAETAWLQSTGNFAAAEQLLSKAGYSARLLGDGGADASDTTKTAVGAWSQAMIALLAGSLMMIWAMGFDQVGLGDPGINLVIILASAGIIALSGGHFFRRAIAALRHRMATMDTLIALSTGAAWVHSSYALAPGVLLLQSPPAMIFYESAFFIIGFVNLGKSFESHIRIQAAGAISALSSLQPTIAFRLGSVGAIEQVAVEQVVIGDLIQVTQGGRIPLDGIVRAGSAALDVSLMTGESALQAVSVGQSVIGGTLNVDGMIEVEVTQVGQATVMQQMIRDLKRAQNSKPALASRVDQVSAWFVPLILVVAVVAALIWSMAGSSTAFAVETMMTVLIVACPCALGLAVPMSVMVSVGRAAKAGLMIRNGRVLEAAREVSTVIFDKTGTLTLGQPEVEAHHWFTPLEDEIQTSHLQALRRLLTRSEHVLSQALVRFLVYSPIELNVASAVFDVGQGGSGHVQGERFAFGRLDYLHRLGLKGGEAYDASDVRTRVYWGADGQVCGVFLLTDVVRDSARSTIEILKGQGKRVIMLTGDHESPAGKIAETLDIEFEAGLTPDQKQSWIQSIQSSGAVIAMVGDGLNDAGALALADVSIAMAQGTEASIQAADLTLLSNDLTAVPRLMALSQQTIQNIQQNLVFAFLYNVTLIPIAAGLLYPSLGWRIDPSLAGLAMALSSISVVLNAVRLSRRPLLSGQSI